MNTYRILITNGVGLIIYDAILIGNDENEVLKKLLDRETICIGDIIKIEEV